MSTKHGRTDDFILKAEYSCTEIFIQMRLQKMRQATTLPSSHFAACKVLDSKRCEFTFLFMAPAFPLLSGEAGRSSLNLAQLVVCCLRFCLATSLDRVQTLPATHSSVLSHWCNFYLTHYFIDNNLFSAASLHSFSERRSWIHVQNSFDLSPRRDNSNSSTR